MVRGRTGLATAAAALAALAVLAAALSGCGPSASTVKANAQQARKALDDIVYYDVELLLVPTVVMRTTEPTAVATARQAADMKAWLGRDLAVIESRSKALAAMAHSPGLGDSKTDELLVSTSAWLEESYLPAIRAAVSGVAPGRTLGEVEAKLGAPWSGTLGEAAKGRIATLRAALAKKAGG